jgi:hypothetical protein
MLGIPLGILIGIISGLTFVVLLHTAWSSTRDSKSIILLIAELLAIPTFWFGGTWLTTIMLKDIQLNTILPDYLVSLTCTFVVIAMYPLSMIVIQFGNNIRMQEGDSDA